MTIISLIIVFFQQFVRVPQVDAILASSDTLVCVVFLRDRAVVSPRRSSGPTCSASTGTQPAARVVRFAREHPGDRRAPGAADLPGRPAVSLGTSERFSWFGDGVLRRAESAVYVIILTSFVVLLLGSCLIAFVEPLAEGSNIKTGGDAFWWAFVTITTVGYGDRFPVTPTGRFVGMVTMAVGSVSSVS